MTEPQITEAFAKTCTLLHQRGYRDIAANAEVVNEQIDDNWRIAFNPTMDSLPLECGYELPAMSVSVTHKDFPCGVFGALDGAMMADAEADYIAALDAQITA